MAFEEYQRGDFSISTDPARLVLEAIYSYLSRSYWAAGRSKEVVARSLIHSLCFGLYRQTEQIGLSRVISDFATYAYLCDVYILEEYRGQGLSKWLMATILAHPDLQGLRRWSLVTRDAHGLYAQFGFVPLPEPARYMVLQPQPPNS